MDTEGKFKLVDVHHSSEDEMTHGVTLKFKITEHTKFEGVEFGVSDINFNEMDSNEAGTLMSYRFTHETDEKWTNMPDFRDLADHVVKTWFVVTCKKIENGEMNG